MLVNVTGGLDMTLLEVDEAANAISDQVDPEANIIFGAAFDPALEGKIRVSVVATGMDGQSIARHRARSSRAAITARPLLVKDVAPARSRASRRVSEPEPARARRPTSRRPPADPVPAEIARRGLPARVRGAARRGRGRRPSARACTRRQPAPIVDPAVGRARTSRRCPAGSPESTGQPQKGGWLSLFGDAAPARSDASRCATAARDARHQPAAGCRAGQGRGRRSEDLEIPSFLRRLAN